MEEAQVASALRPFQGECHCGDAVGCWTRGLTTFLAVFDGLGHGKHAQSAAQAAMAYVSRHLHQPLPLLFSACGEAIRGTRGVAMGIAAIDERTGVLTYGGIGNTRAMICGKRIKRLSGNYGIVGSAFKRLTLEKAQLAAHDLVLLSTDGLKEIIDVSPYGDLLSVDLKWLSERILEDWGLLRDDGAVLIYRKGEGCPEEN